MAVSGTCWTVARNLRLKGLDLERTETDGKARPVDACVATLVSIAR